MNKKKDPQTGLKKLVEHLGAFEAQDTSPLSMESDMLSQIVSGALKGEDISRRYPAFYRKLLENPDLRQAFLDALDSLEAERAGDLVPMLGAGNASLDFLEDRTPGPAVERLEKENWRFTWKKSLEQLQALFSPGELAYRAGLDPLEDPWFTLLRDELTAAGTTFAVTLECSLSRDRDDALAAFLNLAVTLGSTPGPEQFPLRATLRWGTYHESVLLTGEGRARFPDILLSAVFDPSQDYVQAGLSLTLETRS